MSEVVVRKVGYAEIGPDFLDGFNRHQITEKVVYWDKGQRLEKSDHFTNEWDVSRLRRIASELRDISLVGSVIAAFHEGKVIGFTCITDNIFSDGYVNMPYLHVSFEYRGSGIGRSLFEKIQDEAKSIGAKKIYISGHPDVMTQAFYSALRCVPAKRINKVLFDEEPLDIHLEKEL